MFNDKILNCRDCGRDFEFSASEQEFYAEKGFTTEPGRCPECRAAKKNKPETKAAVAIHVNNVKCSQLFALLVEKKLRFLSNLLATNLFIAVSATNPVHVATGKSLILETLPG